VSAPLALTMGEPAGIGGELTLKTWRERRADLPPFVAIDDPERLTVLARRLGWSVPIAVVSSAAEGVQRFDHALPVLPITLPRPVEPGRLDPANSPAVLEAIRLAVDLTRKGEASAVVTNPLHKLALYEAGFRHPGHTEYLAELSGPGVTPVMMLACPALRVVPVTIHLALADAVKRLRREEIVACGRILAQGLARDCGIERPRIAVAGLNPHAGETGSLGREEIETIAPAIEELRAGGIAVAGPLAPDTMFHVEARARYDAALCMYHDQALIPIKTLDFWGGVNVTLGLPFVRTSPDHGTALDIAGRGSCNEASLVAALRLAADMASRRRAAGLPSEQNLERVG
jgi:4-hydroxythreonine-4-phosphate dehydrogenase